MVIRFPIEKVRVVNQEHEKRLEELIQQQYEVENNGYEEENDINTER